MWDLLRGTSSAAAMRLLRTLASFGCNVLLGRLLGVEGVGLYFLAYAVVRISSVIAQFGLARTVLRWSAAAAADSEWSTVRALYRKAMLLSGGLSIVVSALVIWQAQGIASIFGNAALAPALQLMSIGILPWTLVTLHSQFLLGLRRTREALFVEGVGIPLVHLPLLLVLGGSYGLLGASASFAVSATAVLGLGFVLLRRALPAGQAGTFETETLVKTSVPLFWMDVTSVGIGLTDTVLLGLWRDPAEVGLYNVTRRVAVLTSAMLTAVNVVVAPRFAALYRQGKMDALRELAQDSAKLVALTAVPYLLAVLLVPHWILGVFGSEFVAGSPALALLAIGQFVAAITGSVGFLLIMTGHERAMRNTTMAAAALNILLQLFLIPAFGFVGAAAATAASSVVSNLVAMMLVWHYLSIFTMPLPNGIVRWLTRRIPTRSDSSDAGVHFATGEKS